MLQLILLFNLCFVMLELIPPHCNDETEAKDCEYLIAANNKDGKSSGFPACINRLCEWKEFKTCSDDGDCADLQTNVAIDSVEVCWKGCNYYQSNSHNKFSLQKIQKQVNLEAGVSQ